MSLENQSAYHVVAHECPALRIESRNRKRHVFNRSPRHRVEPAPKPAIQETCMSGPSEKRLQIHGEEGNQILNGICWGRQSFS